MVINSNNRRADYEASANPNPMVKAELNLLAHLMGAVEKKTSGGPGKENDFRISMKFAATRPPPDMYDVKIQTSEELSRIMGDMAIPDASGPSSKGDDLLELMDSAS
ncbi:protein OSCP1-like [Strongylocentrotus purpuratus]|uniref:Uncharacterized protein n=1 Tax=Strongylocentrotus purpuratus TaxID=7668 RepID=A0A7M7PEV0_STRPU|nr:protein OSCP1-like [Strongylocentrotus purpuratus]